MNISSLYEMMNLSTDKTIYILINLSLVISLTLTFFLTKNTMYKNSKQYIVMIYQYTRKPLFFLSVIYLLYYLVLPIIVSSYPKIISIRQYEMLNYLLNALAIIFSFWLIFEILSLGKKSLMRWAERNNHSTILVILPAISESLNAAFFLIMCNAVMPYLAFTGIANYIFAKGLKILLILIIGWISVKLIYIFENIIITQYNSSNSTDITIRKLKTQISILRRILLTLISIITTAALLMMFDSVKNLGTGILTTAGLVSALGAFASQQSLSRIFSGLQLAFTQPIRIGDTVVVDNEYGQIEEINLSFVTIKLWDLRRLIKPTDYFTKNGILNLTRESSQLFGTVIIYVDYTFPVNQLREKFQFLLNSSKYWDKNVGKLDVTDVTERCIQIRLLISAANADLLWNLRCEIREKIMAYIVEEHPERLTRARSLTAPLTSNK